MPIQINKGFTLIELVSTIAVLSIFAVMAISSLGSVKKSFDMEYTSSQLVEKINGSRTESIKSSQYMCTTISPDNTRKHTTIKTYKAINLDQTIQCPCAIGNQCNVIDNLTLENSLVFHGTQQNITILHESKTGTLLNSQNLKLDIVHSNNKANAKRQVEVKVGGLATLVFK